jgi:hypothetical protein
LSILFDAIDPRGLSIRCEKKQWCRHVVAHRPGLEEHLDLVRQTIENPLMICSDATNPNREIYYSFGILPAPFDKLYLKVVVEFSERAEKRYGTVITVFTPDTPKTGEELIWTSPHLQNFRP